MSIPRTLLGPLVTALLPSIALAFVPTDAGVVHDVGVPTANPVGIATLSSSATIMVGTMSTGDGVTFAAPLFVRVGPDGRVVSTRMGEGMTSFISRVTDGPDDTILTLAGSLLILYDANGNELWTASGGTAVVGMLGDTTGITLLARAGASDGILRRLAPDGSVLWQTTLSEAVGCAPQCPPFSPSAMTDDPNLGIVVLTDYPSTPPEAHLFAFSTDGALLWQTLLAPVNNAKLARSNTGRLAVLGSNPSTAGLLLQEYGNDGTPAWSEAIASADTMYAVDVSFDDADSAYTLEVSSAWSTHAFDSAGNLRWTHALPNGSVNGGLEVGWASQPITIISESPSGDFDYGIAQDGRTAFDGKLDQLAGVLCAWHRFPDGGLAALDLTRGSFETMSLGLMSPDGIHARYAIPDAIEVPTQAWADGIAWQDDGQKTIVALGSQQFVVRFDASGDELWRANLPEAGRAIARAIGSDTLIGMGMGTESGPVTTLTRRSADGAVLWQATEPYEFSDLAAGADGGSFLITYTFDLPAVWNIERRDPNGVQMWTSPLGVVPAMSKQGELDPPNLMPAQDGSVYAYGRYGEDGFVFVEHFDASGTLLWFQSFGGLTNFERGLAEDENGVLYLEYDASPFSGVGIDAWVFRLTPNGDIAWSVEFEGESASSDGRSLIAARGGGTLLETSTGVHRIDASGVVTWTYAEDCTSGCFPNSIRQSEDGKIVALSTVGSREPIPEGPTDIAVYELDESGNLLDSYVSGPHPHSADFGLDVRVDGSNVDVAELSMSPDGLSRVHLERFEQDRIFENGFDP